MATGNVRKQQLGGGGIDNHITSSSSVHQLITTIHTAASTSNNNATASSIDSLLSHGYKIFAKLHLPIHQKSILQLLLLCSILYSGSMFYQMKQIHYAKIVHADEPSQTQDVQLSFCHKGGSLHQIGLDMFNYSSPPGSPSFNKLKHVMDSNSQFHVVANKEAIFKKTQEAVRRMLKGYGLEEETGVNQSQSAILVEMFSWKPSSPCPLIEKMCRHRSRIYIQSEQYVSGQYQGRIKAEMHICHDSPTCVIWEFSDYTYNKLRREGEGMEKSVVLLPIMTQSPSRLSSLEPTVPKVLKERSHDIVFFGAMTSRRKSLFNGRQSYLKKYPNRSVLFKSAHGKPEIASGYKDAKVCIMGHSYGTESGGEYHRLSELARFGCVPVFEHFTDWIGIDVYQQCGGVVFTSFDNLWEVASDVVAEIDKGNYEIGLSSDSHLKWWKRGIQWELLFQTIYHSE